MDNSQKGDGAPSQFIVGSNAEENDQSKLLGIIWNCNSDDFTFCFTELIDMFGKLPANRRSLLRVTASIFDPLGFLSPFVVRLKLLFQTLCCNGVGWDEPLEGKSFKLWNEFLSELTILNQIRIPRCYFDKDVTPACLELHGFSDASEHAYAAVLYLRTVSNDGIVVACYKTRNGNGNGTKRNETK